MNLEEEKSPLEKSTPDAQDGHLGDVEPARNPTPTLEDRQVESQPAVSEPASTAPAVQKESWAKRAVRWILVALIFLVAGAAAVYFTLTLNATRQVDALNLAATSSADQIATLDADLQGVRSELAAATATVEAQTGQIKLLSLESAVYKMQSDVNTIRTALLKEDSITAAQALGNARSDIAALSELGVDPSTLDGFTTRLNNASRTLSSDPQQSMIELDNLIDNLFLLATNLK